MGSPGDTDSSDPIVHGLEIRSLSAVPWVLKRGWALGRIYVDVRVKGRKSKVQKVLGSLEVQAEAEGVVLIRNRDGLDQSKVVLRFPVDPTPEPPTAGVREPRRPHAPTSSFPGAIEQPK